MSAFHGIDTAPVVRNASANNVVIPDACALSRRLLAVSGPGKQDPHAGRFNGLRTASVAASHSYDLTSRRQKKYERPQSTPVAVAQPHTSGPLPTEKWAMSAETRVMAKPV